MPLTLSSFATDYSITCRSTGLTSTPTFLSHSIARSSSSSSAFKFQIDPTALGVHIGSADVGDDLKLLSQLPQDRACQRGVSGRPVEPFASLSP
jgi:hypothetical protein